MERQAIVALMAATSKPAQQFHPVKQSPVMHLHNTMEQPICIPVVIILNTMHLLPLEFSYVDYG